MDKTNNSKNKKERTMLRERETTDTDTDTCLLRRPPAHTQGEVGGGGVNVKCSHLSVVVGNMYTFV